MLSPPEKMSVSELIGALSFHLVPLLLSGLCPSQFQQEGHVQSSLANNFVYPQKQKSVLPLNLQKQAETWKKSRRRVEYLFIKSTYSWRIYTYSSQSSSFLSRVFYFTSLELRTHSETTVKEETCKTKAKKVISYLAGTCPTNISFFRVSRKFFPLTWMVGTWKGEVCHVCKFFKDNKGKNFNI